jgi:hypothetical protein
MFPNRVWFLSRAFEIKRWGRIIGVGALGAGVGIAIGACAAGFGGNHLFEVVATAASGEVQSPGTGPLPSIDAGQAAILTKSTIMAVHQANQTGNYSVLRDLGTPGFRERFDQARLTAVFAKLRGLQADLSLILPMTPSLSREPELTAANRLHLIGSFSSQPLQVSYDLLFVWIGDQWRIEGLAIDTITVEAITGTQSMSPPAAGNSVPQGHRATVPS